MPMKLVSGHSCEAVVCCFPVVTGSERQMVEPARQDKGEAFSLEDRQAVLRILRKIGPAQTNRKIAEIAADIAGIPPELRREEGKE